MNTTGRLAGVILFFIAMIFAWVPPTRAEDVADLYRKGYNAQKAGNLKEAMGIYEGCLKADPKNYKALLAMGTVYLAMGEYRKATEQFRSVLALYPDDPRTRLYLANSRLKAGFIGEAKNDYEMILSEYPEDVPALIGLARAEYLLGNRFTAVDFLKQALALQPGNTALKATVDRVESAARQNLAEEERERHARLMSDLENAIAEASLSEERARAALSAAGIPEHLSPAQKMILLDLSEPAALPEVRAFPRFPKR